ncbi:uncharacterized protein LOC128982830 isoform X2 [Macrosteles quadrilineatus]|uniref:uncharacterized protein LOC128982830 isoform X2 n=1 Tax=Macrosteles quadrilineatus TaxID=74068 RepID=UPI0023E15DA4|nr:uncharacterized protein LOC128982830 isoform X2 [Macrosteles quadrilineatus]
MLPFCQMDNSNRRVKKINTRKLQEMNGNSKSNSSYKVDNTRRQKHTRDCCNKEEHDRERMNEVFSSYLQGQRLFTAVSDPAVCAYPMSLGYTYPDSIPVPLGYPVFHPHQFPHKVPYNDQKHSPRNNFVRKPHGKQDQSKDTFQTVDEYTSLPPGNLQDVESDQQRRFSDPGLANNSESEVDSLSEQESSASGYGDSELTAQIETLVLENKRLSKELKETQSELQDLKIEIASLATVQSSCEPGFISELVREVHEATKLKEDTLLTKVKLFAENLLSTRTQYPLPNVTQSEDDAVTQRLTRLEEQMKTILAHNSMQENVKKELSACQQNNLQLKEELKSAVKAKDLAEATATKYERLFNMVKKNVPNGVVLDDKEKAQHSLDTSESLTSSLGSSLPPSSPSPSPSHQVTMSGPVTDL